MLWKGCLPQTRSMGGQFVKLMYCCSPDVQDLLQEYFALTGGKAKKGKAPLGLHEREAADLLKKLGK